MTALSLPRHAIPHRARDHASGSGLRLNEVGPLVSLAAFELLRLGVRRDRRARCCEGETQTFDRALLLALRDPHDLADPIGPGWLEEAARDITGLGGYAVLTIVTSRDRRLSAHGGQARRGACSSSARGRRRHAPVDRAQARLRAAAARSRAPWRARLHGELPERPRHAVGRHLSDARRAARPRAGAAPRQGLPDRARRSS